MKKAITLIIGALLFSSVFSQPPQSFSYQAILRNTDGTIKANESVSVLIEILQGGIEGLNEYMEIHNFITTSTGLINLKIGSGTTSDDFSAIDWSNGPYFLKVTVNGINLGASQMLSVPYALHSKTAEAVTGIITEIDPLYTGSEAANITATDITNLGNLSGTNTGDQDLSTLATEAALGDSTAKVRSEIPTEISDLNMNANSQNITNLANPVNNQDAATKSYVTLVVSSTGDTLFLGTEQWVIIPGISWANSGSGRSIEDGSGNIYTFVNIGTQDWLVENLKTTKYNDGTDIPLVTDGTAWDNLTTPGYCWYDNDQTTYGDTYGALYNWHTVKTGDLCPVGWHVPTDAEWTQLTDYLGGGSFAGDKLKETGTTHWESPNTGATNESEFTALPGGTRFSYGGFDGIGNGGHWWSATKTSPSNAWYRRVASNHSSVHRLDGEEKNGFSVRCLRD